MDEEKKEQGKKCFIITPIGSDGSETFRKAKGVIDSVIKPVLYKKGFDDIKPAYEIVDSGMIGNQIVNRIVNDDLVVANLTGNNPNVMYELAIRHASAKPIIHICENGTVLPFDIKDNRTIFYADDMLGVQELQNNFETFVEKIDYSNEYMDNPIYSGIKMETIFKKMHDEGQQDIAEILQKILDRVSDLPGTNNIIASKKSNRREDLIINITISFKDHETERKFTNTLFNITGLYKIDTMGLNEENIRRHNLYFNALVRRETIINTIYEIADELGIKVIECKILT